MGVGMIAVIGLHLVAALIAGLLVFQLVHMLSAAVRIPYIGNRYAKVLFVAVLAIIVVTVLALAGVGVGVFLRRGPDNLALLLTQLAVIIDDLRRILPDSVVAFLPTDADGVKRAIAEWFRENAVVIRTIGTDTLRIVVHILIGLIIGAMIALHEVTPRARSTPFTRALAQRAQRLALAFRRILLAQVPISAINTLLTTIYLAGVLPYFDIKLPFIKTLIAVTFIAGLLPVVGNLISNTVIFLISLTHSFALGAASLGYLVVIHKLEYFLNARIVGNRIKAKAWELLMAMLLFESMFGLTGLIMGPLVYAYVKYELDEQGLI
ncbi:MAG: AI-2E family transporter [Gammaproteobacteria bacterium]|nr:AI-2E family transporter [Gammaproteobacteria bacterium]